MSISTARSFIEKSGCGHVVGVVLIVVLVAGLFYSGQCTGPGREGPDLQKESVISLGTIGTQPISLNQIRQFADAGLSNAAGDEQGLDPMTVATTYGQATIQAVDMAIIQHLAKQKSISVSQADVEAFGQKQIDGQIKGIRQQLEQMGMIKPNATQAEFDAALKQANGTTEAELRAQVADSFKRQLESPEGRASIEFQALTEKLSVNYGGGKRLSDEELKKYKATYVTKRVIFTTAKHGNDAYKKAENALKEIKGGLSFESAMNKYSDDPAMTGKQKSDSTINLDVFNMTYDDSYKSVLLLKEGQISGIVKTSSGPAIFKIISKNDGKAQFPDFDKRKEDYRENWGKLLASKSLNADMRKFLEEGQIKWSSPSAKVLFDWQKTQFDPELRGNTAELKKQNKALWERADKLVETGDPADPKLVSSAKFGTFRTYYDSLSVAEQETISDKWIELTLAAMQDTEHAPTRVELAKKALKLKNKELFASNLQFAADMNSGISEAAIERHVEYAKLIDQGKAAGLLSGEPLARLNETQKAWRDGAFEQVKGEAEANSDYRSAGLAAHDQTESQAKKFAARGYIGQEQLKEIRAVLSKWVSDAVKDIKERAKSNTDYSATGQTEFADINFMVESLKKKNLISSEDVKEVEQLQAKWRSAKLKADQAAEKTKANEAKKPEAKAPAQPGSTEGGSPPSVNQLTTAGGGGR